MWLLNPYRFVTAGGGYFLDSYNPVMLYSLHQVDSADSDLIRVRRDSDNAELDFNATEISDGTLTTWTGANNGYIAKWYNLGSGGATYDAVQTTAANQPRIVNAGTLETDPQNGNAAIWFDGTNDYLNLSTGYTFPSAATELSVVNRNATGNNSITFAKAGAGFPHSMRWTTSNSTNYRPGNNIANWNADTQTGDVLTFIYYTSPTAVMYRNNSIASPTSISVTHATPYTLDTIGRLNTLYHDDEMQFACFFASDENANRTDLQDLVNDVLSIY